MAAPSLSELTNFRVDPALGGSSPRVIIDNKGVVDTLNRAAEFQVENSWKKYNQFQKNLSDVYENLNEDARLDTMPQDREVLGKQSAAIFHQISEDPSALNPGSPKYRQIQEQLYNLKKDAFTSRKDYLFDQAHREFLSRQPELNTPENTNQFDQFGNTPLGKRKPFTLNMPPQFDYDAYRKGILGLATKPFADTKMTGEDLTSPGRDFIVDREGEKISKDAFLKLWQAGYETSTDKYGHSIKGAIQQRFNLLPKEVQDQYKEKAEQTGVKDPVKEFFNETGETEFNALGQEQGGFITNVKKVTTKQNEFALKDKEADEKLKQMKVKFGYDELLEAMKLGGQKDLALYREQIKDLNGQQQAEVLNGLVDRQVQDAKNNPVQYPTGERLNWNKLDVSPETYKIFGIKEQGTGTLANKTETIYPDELLVSPDGETVTALFKNKNAGKPDANGNIIPVVDQSKTRQFSIEEYKYRIGKDILGAGNLGKQLTGKDGKQGAAGGGHVETRTGLEKESKKPEAPEKLSGSVNPSQLVKGNKYDVNGKTYIWDGKKLQPQ